MVEFKQIRFYCLFPNSFTAQTSPKHVCAKPSSCHSIACITSPKCCLLSAFHLIICASSLAPSLALVDPHSHIPFPSYRPQNANEGQTSCTHQLAECFSRILHLLFPIAPSLSHFFSICVYACAFYILHPSKHRPCLLACNAFYKETSTLITPRLLLLCITSN